MSEASYPATFCPGHSDEVKVTYCSYAEARVRACHFADSWKLCETATVASRAKSHCVLDVLELFTPITNAGAMVVMASDTELKLLAEQSSLPHTAAGFMTKRLKIHVSNNEFKRIFFQITSHSETERWAEDCPDEQRSQSPASLGSRPQDDISESLIANSGTICALSSQEFGSGCFREPGCLNRACWTGTILVWQIGSRFAKVGITTSLRLPKKS